MSKHTPGLLAWDAGDIGNEHEVLYCDVFAKADESVVASLGTADLDLAKGNAARITATWNVCTGISTEALKEGAVKKLITAVEALLEENPVFRRPIGAEGSPARIRQGRSIVAEDEVCTALASFKEEG